MNCLELFVHIWCFRWLLSTAKVDVMPVLPSLRHVIAGIWMHAQKCRSCTMIQNLYSCLTTGLTVFFYYYQWSYQPHCDYSCIWRPRFSSWFILHLFFSLHVFIFFYLKDAFKWWLTVFLNLCFVYVVLALNLSVLVFTSLFYCREVPRGLSRPPYKKRLEKEKWDIQIYRRLTRRFDDTFMTI